MSGRGDVARIATARTFLFVPAHEREKVDKALTASPDAVILDLEDGVPEGAKEEARGVAVEVLERTHEVDCLLLVRVNDPLGETGAGDVEAVGGRPGAVMVPKADPERIAAVGDEPPVVALVESAAGIAAAEELARDRRVERLMLGSLDLAVDLDLVLSADGIELAAARWRLTLASRLAGIAAPIDGVYPLHRDAEGLRRDAAAGRAAGMRAKACIHPAQLGVVAEAFSPSPAELRWASRVLDAWEAAGGDAGTIDVDGEMVDAPVLLRAHAIRDAAGAGRRAERVR